MNSEQDPRAQAEGQDLGAPVNDWVNVVRRARLGPTVKLVALTIATYADADGEHVFPGIARLAVQCELSYRAVQYSVAGLRDAGLLGLVRRGARRSGKSDEYRLILAADLLEHCDVPTPAAERLEIERLTSQEKARREKSRSTRTQRRIEPVDNQPPPPGPKAVHTQPGACEKGSTRTTAHVLHAPGFVPPSIDLSLEKQPPSDEAARRTPRTGSARDAEEAERKRQIDGLAEWEREQDGRAACPRCGQRAKVMSNGYLKNHGPVDPRTGVSGCHRVKAPSAMAS